MVAQVASLLRGRTEEAPSHWALAWQVQVETGMA